MTSAPRFEARVARNALEVVERELSLGPAIVEAHRARLAALGFADDAALVVVAPVRSARRRRCRSRRRARRRLSATSCWSRTRRTSTSRRLSDAGSRRRAQTPTMRMLIESERSRQGDDWRSTSRPRGRSCPTRFVTKDALVQGDRRVPTESSTTPRRASPAALDAAGVEPGAKVALYLYNCPEYLVAQFGAFKHRAMPVNVNYRYLDDELAYLLDDSDAEVLVFHSSLGDRVGRVRDRCAKPEAPRRGRRRRPAPRRLGPVRRARGGHEPQPRKARSGQDLSMLYTGGTTGMPKGVMSRQGPYIEGIYRASALLVGFGDVPTERRADRRDRHEWPRRRPHVAIPCCPLMHGTGLGICAMPALLRGGTIVLLEQRTFDPTRCGRLCRARAGHGDRHRRRRLRASDAARARGARARRSCPTTRRACSDIVSAGTIWSAEIKDALGKRLDARLIDMLGSSEGGIYAVSSAGRDAPRGDGPVLAVAGARSVSPRTGATSCPGRGSRASSRAASNAFGYYKDPEKTARTFREIDGRSYVLTGDWATVEADGGSPCSDAARTASTRAARRSSPRRSKRRSSATPTSTTAWSSACPTSGSGSASWRSSARRARRRRAARTSASGFARRCRTSRSRSPSSCWPGAPCAERQGRLRVGEGRGAQAGRVSPGAPLRRAAGTESRGP